MARNSGDGTVLLHEGLFRSDKLRDLRLPSRFSEASGVTSGFVAALLYPYLLLLGHGANRGVFEDDANAVASRVFPKNRDVSADSISKWLDLMEEVGLIRRYQDSHGRKLAAFLHFKGWGTNKRIGRNYEPPPECHDEDSEWNVPNDAPGQQLSLLGSSEETDEQPSWKAREIIDFYYRTWKAPRQVGKPYTKSSLTAVQRALREGYDVAQCKVSIFLARYGPHGWYREANHAFEYLIRPGVIEEISQKNERFVLKDPRTAKLARELGVYEPLAQMFLADRGDSAAVLKEKLGRVAEQSGLDLDKIGPDLNQAL
jgi:hypothetical protein